MDNVIGFPYLVFFLYIIGYGNKSLHKNLSTHYLVSMAFMIGFSVTPLATHSSYYALLFLKGAVAFAIMSATFLFLDFCTKNIPKLS